MTPEEFVNTLNKKYGHQTAQMANSISSHLDVVPTGILALDYELGTGGWPFGKLIEVFGPPSIGKTSLLGFNAIRNAQALGHYCSYIALEPGFDPTWAKLNGIDLDKLIVTGADDGEQAFQILKDCVTHTRLVVFDSLAAVFRKSQIETKTDGSVVTMGGASSLIAAGIGTIAMKAEKNHTCVILINQQRNNMALSGVYDSPGGNAPKHFAHIRIQMRFGGSPLKLSDGTIYGHELRATVKKNKCSRGSVNRTVNFTYYIDDVGGHRIGIDEEEDVIATALRTKALENRGAFYYHPMLPDGRIQGKEKLAESIRGNPEFIADIRERVLAAMIRREDKNE